MNDKPLLQAVTVGRIGSRLIRPASYRHSVYLWGIKLYELRPRRKDGVLVWRLASSWSERSGPKPSAKLIDEAKDWAKANGIRFEPYIVDKQRCTLSDLELIALLGKEAE